MTTRPLPSRLPRPAWRSHWLESLAVFAAASAGTYFAQALDRPITAVLIYLSGVIVIAARAGMRSAVLAAVGASLAYNFFLSEPVFRFGVSSLDSVVPLLAFNLCAIGTGALVGRLKDSASQARRAQAKSAFLLTVSDRLQRALKLEEVESAVRGVLPTQGVADVEIFLARGKHYVRPATGEAPIAQLEPLMRAEAETGAGPRESFKVLELAGAGGALGIVKFRLTGHRQWLAVYPDLESIAGLLALAVERCVLLEQLAETRVQQQADELKDAILSSISHDLRTPLTAIEAAASGLRSAECRLSGEERDALLGSIIEQCARLNRFTADLLDMGRIHSGISASEFASVDLGEILAVVISHIRSAFPALRIDKQLGGELAVINGNAVMLEQAIFNLMHNAAKHSGAAQAVTVRLRLEAGEAVLEIEDDGPGIAPEEQALVFDRFYRSPASGQGDGSGLGLYIARGFVEAFGGRIAVTSPIRDGRGARMALLVPLAPGAGPEAQK